MAFKTNYIISISPLAKVFQERLQPHIIRAIRAGNSKIIWEEVHFKIVVPKSSGTFTLEHAKPRLVTMKDCHNQPDNMEPLINWLTGGPEGVECTETDHTGITFLDVGMDVMGVLSSVILMGDGDKAEQESNKLLKEARKEFKEAMGKAARISEERIMRVVRKIHEHKERQYEANIEHGIGKFKPTFIETICAEILKVELETREKEERDDVDNYAKTLEKIKGVS